METVLFCDSFCDGGFSMGVLCASVARKIDGAQLVLEPVYNPVLSLQSDHDQSDAKVVSLFRIMVILFIECPYILP